jgi:alkylation response protein AidB-like acyl-CoA dehydrogenase
VHTSACTLPILAFGTEEQRERLRAPLASGEKIGAFALTEPEAGSDAGALRTRADADGDGWTITGAKQWITNGSYAGTFLTFARSEAEIEGARGVSAFLLDAEHVRVTREEEKLGLNSSSTADLLLEGARVGRDRLLHEEGRGFVIAMATLDGGRIGIAAGGRDRAGRLRRSPRVRQGRRTLGSGSPSTRRSVEARGHVDRDRRRPAAHLPCGLAEAARRAAREAGAKAKLFASEVARHQTAEAIQILGGYGYTKEFPVGRYYRDARITEIYGGRARSSDRHRAQHPSCSARRRRRHESRDEPVRLTRIYTRGGDAGETSLRDGSRVSKLDCRIGAFGTVDELSSALGVVLAGDVPGRCAMHSSSS